MLGLLLPDAHAGHTLDARERSYAIMLTFSPKGASPRVSSGDLLKAASDSLRSLTDLELKSVEQAGVNQAELDDCPLEYRFSCWTRTILRSYSEASYLIVVSISPVDGKTDRLQTLLLDLHFATQLKGSAEEVEDATYEAAERSERQVVESTDSRALRKYFDTLLESRFKKALRQSGHIQAAGAIRIETDEKALQVSLDGRYLGTASDQTRIIGIQPGLRGLLIVSGSSYQIAMNVEVIAGEEVMIDPDLEIRDSEPHVLRTATVWTGIALAVTGAIITAATLAPSETNPGVTFYYERPEEEEPGIGLHTGVGLFTLGLSSALLASFMGDRGEAPWFPIAIGLLSGGAAFSLSFALF